jgi:3-oxoacyl-[acyl-carrier protein] reductase
MKDPEGLSILITGGGSGIGAATARYFVERGARVTICGTREEKVRGVAESLGERCLGVLADVTRAEDRQNLMTRAVAHGKGRLDALINNAANMLRGAITDLNEAELQEVFHTNVISGMMLTGMAVPHLEQTQGSVIFLGSVHTRRSFPGASPYAATKGALEALTKVLAAELGARKIRVNCVVPGAVPTELNIRAGLFTEEEHAARMDAIAPFHVLQRVGTPEEIAEAIDYLIRADWTTGASLVVDGGLSLGLAPF